MGLTALSIRIVDPLRAVHILLLFVNYVLRRSKAVNLMHTLKARDFDCRMFKPLKDLVQGSSGAHYLVVVISENVSVFRQYKGASRIWTMQANL